MPGINQCFLKASGEQFHLDGYYPPLLNESEYSRLLVAIDSRKRHKRCAGGKSDYPGIFTGLGIATCGTCDAAIVSQNQVRQTKNPDKPSVYRRLRCQYCELDSRKGRNASTYSGFDAKFIEKAILDYCSDQFNLDSLLDKDESKNGKLMVSRAAILERISSNERNLKRMVELMLEVDGPLPTSLVEKMRSIEKSIADDKAREQLVTAEISLSEAVPTATAKAWQGLREGVLGLDYDTRLKCRQMILDTFTAVKVYFKGAHSSTGEPTVNVLLTSKTGESRLLVIDRKSGAMLEAVKVETLTDNAAARAVRVSTLATRH